MEENPWSCMNMRWEIEEERTSDDRTSGDLWLKMGRRSGDKISDDEKRDDK